MKVLIALAAIALVTALPASAPAAPDEPVAAGLWQKTGSSGMPEAWFRVMECDGAFIGRIVKIFAKPGENPANLRCTGCAGDQKNAPVLGLTFIKGMRRNGLAYQGGSIIDPRDGSVYNAQMQISPDGKQLSVRGYIGIPLLGQSETWHRVPDSSTGQPDRFASCPRAGSSAAD
jgi:uncharacterized protein (DUF2147 family)